MTGFRDFLEITAPLFEAGAVYCTSVIGIQIISEIFSQKINTEKQLEEIVKEEAEKIGLDPRSIVSNFVPRGEAYKYDLRGARSTAKGYDSQKDEIVPVELVDGQGIIKIHVLDILEGWGANRGAVKHELYHLKHHFPRAKNPTIKFLKWLYEEPAASIYSILR